MIERIITSSALIVVLVLLRYLLRGRVSLRLQYALWILVAVRLLAPVAAFASPISILNAVELFAAGSQGITETAVSAESTASAIENPTTEYATEVPSQYEEVIVVSGDDADAAFIQDSEPGSGAAFLSDLGHILPLVWISGMLLTGAGLLGVNLLFRRRLRQTAVFMALSDASIPVYLAEGLSSPCLFGLFHPAVYLTPESFEDGRLRYVLTHELTHYRHGDHIWAFIRCVCLVVYWFNPLVWLAASLSRRDCELACDEGTLEKLGEGERISYGRTLVDMMTQMSPRDLACTATTMTAGKRGFRERITLIAQKPAMLMKPMVLLIAVVFITVGGTFTSAQSKEEQSATEDTQMETASATEAVAAIQTETAMDYSEDEADRVSYEFAWNSIQISGDITDFQEAADAYGEALAAAFLDGTMGSGYAVTSAELYSADIYDTIEGDETQFCFTLTLMLQPAEPNTIEWMAGHGIDLIEEGPDQGKWLWYEEIKMQKTDGVWQCVEMGTGGVQLNAVYINDTYGYAPELPSG